MKPSSFAFFRALVLAGLGLIDMSFAGLPSPNDDLPSRIESVSGKSCLSLIDHSKPLFELVLPDDACPMVRFAAEEIQQRIRQSAGVQVAVVTVPSGHGLLPFYLGDQRAVRDAGICVDSLPRDGFELKITPTALYLAGRDDPLLSPATKGWACLKEHGTLNGAYGFLERFLGVRYYFPGEIGTIVPRHKTLTVRIVHWLDRPDFPRRRTSFMAGRTWFPEVSPALAVQYRYQLREESFYVPCCHGLDRLRYAHRFGQTHPDYLAMDSQGNRLLDSSSAFFGNICYSSAGMREEIYQDAKAFLSHRPAGERGLAFWDPSSLQPGFFDIMPKDHFVDCMCPGCQRFYATHGGKSDLVWNLICDIAGRLKRNQVPGFLTMLAYGHYTEVPAVQLPENLLVQVAVNGPWAASNPRLQRQHDQRIRAWKTKLGRKPWLWTYIGKYGALDIDGIPPSTPRTVGNYFKQRAGDICGGFIEGETDCQLTQYLNTYVFCKVAWDNRTDVDALLSEHNRLMFGAGALPMGKFLDQLEELWMSRIAGRLVETPLGPVAIPPNARELWEEIYSPTQLRQMEEWFRAARGLARKDTASLRRIDYFETYILNPLRQKSKDYFNELDISSFFSYHSRALTSLPTEEDWTHAPSHWLVPLHEGKAEVTTTFKALLSPKKLHVRIHCEEPLMNHIKADITSRDDGRLWTDSVVELFINPDGKRREYIHFIVNSKGILYDEHNRRNGAGSLSDARWNSSAVPLVKRLPDAWEVSLDIPVAELPGFQLAGCALNVARNRVLKNMKPSVALYASSPLIRSFHDVEHYITASFTDQKIPQQMIDNGAMSLPIVGRSFGKWSTSQQAVQAQTVSMDRKIFCFAGQSLRLTGTPKDRCPSVVQYLTLKPQTTYRLSFMIRTKDIRPNGKGYLGRGGAVVNLAIPGNHWYDPNYYLGTMPWTAQSFVFKTGTPKPSQRFYIRLLLQDALGTAWFDAITIQEIKQSSH